MKLMAWGRSDTGRKRDHNEDNYLVAADIGLFAVADGMGGHQGGDIASKLVLEVLHRELMAVAGDFAGAAERLELAARGDVGRITQEMSTMTDAESESTDTSSGDDEATAGALGAHVLQPVTAVLRAAARLAGQTVFDTALGEPTLRGMGTTLTAMLYDAGRMYVIHAGDSRAYLFRDGSLEQLTSDHSWVSEQVRAGAMTEEEARESKFRHIITRSVGFEREVEVDVRGVAVEPGDCFLLCSDGMSNYLDNDELERLLGTTWYRRTPAQLIDLANQRGGDDNITVVVVYVANESE